MENLLNAGGKPQQFIVSVLVLDLVMGKGKVNSFIGLC